MHKELVVIIHGFAGSPEEVAPLAYTLKRQGYKVVTPLLPGHSHNHKRMKKVDAFEWIQMIEDIVKHFNIMYQKIHLIGFSMGAMIASLIAYQKQISSLVLLSPAIYILTPYLLQKRLGNFFRITRKNHSLPSEKEIHNLSFIRSIPLHNVLQFHKVVRQTKHIFKHISIPICIIHGQLDETADPASSKFIYQVVASQVKELHFLPHSKHHICQGCEVDIVIRLVTNFLNKNHIV